jgi:hypothetical protein
MRPLPDTIIADDRSYQLCAEPRSDSENVKPQPLVPGMTLGWLWRRARVQGREAFTVSVGMEAALRDIFLLL